MCTSALEVFKAPGKVLWRGSQQDRAMIPDNLYFPVNPVYRDSAPPWEKPKKKEDFWADFGKIF